jgi:ubiquinone/menaquinone biosynthesis C-methylase UbiE
MLAEAYRVLKPGGWFIAVSFGTAETRLPLLQHRFLPWNADPNPVFTTESNFIYKA